MSAIILTGGKSTRMGTDKAHLLINGRTMIDGIISALSQLFNEIIISGPTDAVSVQRNFKQVEDIYKGLGPIAGVYSGLFFSTEEINFVTSCDIAEIDVNIVEYMKAALGNSDASIIKISAYVEPLFGFYKKSAMHVLKKCMDEGRYKLSDAFKYMDVRYVADSELRKVSPGFHGLWNINTPEDLRKYENILGIFR
jgi:molybdopterin-guanine dinucleotide biosynthesis protein A